MKKNYTNNIFLSLGSNLGNRILNIEKAIELIQHFIGPVEQSSSLYETEAWGFTSQEAFINQVIKVKSELKPVMVLKLIHQIETDLGRVRKEKWEPRIIDIDILYFDDQCVTTTSLIIPHPLLHERKFVLVPLSELSPQFIHPLLKKTNEQLLKDCSDSLGIRELTS